MLSPHRYFDAHATTPCDPRVVEAMLPFFTDRFGNAASQQHAFGWAARDAVEQARGEVAALIGARVRDIVFTSGATESNNLALKGLLDGPQVPSGRAHVVTVATEHRAVLDACDWLERQGRTVTRLPVGTDGLVDLRRVEEAVRDDTALVSVMMANNEIGVLQPVAAVARLAHARGAAFHTDAAQAAGHVAVDVEAIEADLVSLTAHKIYGPKGVGALYVRRRGPAAALEPLLHGGGHERGLRSGTLNVPAIVGFGVAARIAREGLAAEAARLAAQRDRLLRALQDQLDGVVVNGALEPRLPHNLSVCFAGVEGSRLLPSLTDVAVASGAACSSVSAEPSHVLRALGRTEAEAKASLRFGLCRGTPDEAIDYLIERVVGVVRSLQAVGAAKTGAAGGARGKIGES